VKQCNEARLGEGNTGGIGRGLKTKPKSSQSKETKGLLREQERELEVSGKLEILLRLMEKRER